MKSCLHSIVIRNKNFTGKGRAIFNVDYIYYNDNKNQKSDKYRYERSVVIEENSRKLKSLEKFINSHKAFRGFRFSNCLGEGIRSTRNVFYFVLKV